MLYLQEFEIIPDAEGGFVARPFDMDGATEGDTFTETLEMAADWLSSEINHRLLHGIEIQEASIGNQPQAGGQVVLIGVQTSLDAIARVSASEAAKELNVTPARVTQLLAAGKLEGFHEGRNSYVTRASLDALKASPRRAGRPKTHAAVGV